jgi:drug/metabolite transporter (DMT)-like permease|eukprot:CAMPEP_0174280596 /NCGR_PEP_ID=MMETSP0809-20121228/887_1 /TAXON_ID=73025 ORGANISM="Eutreptiella gymnastica-like, Strain CCMP1594" /NCGR_SAMPLE_ID=MMETSP0809 /ASSEMBLY_ACC=CAM_ASM_000658 /LENGTH=340 /DNA_ID=CAMNT_0015373589 /DNA_START=20 /DNA_END=1042 /DNA_ORIENTATION=+
MAKLDTFWRNVLIAYGCVAVWMASSGAVVLHNKWLMTVFKFSYPATMTMMHMSFSFTIAFLVCKVFKLVQLPVITSQQIMQAILPIGACYSVVLVCSNYAYVYLTVAFIQMLKASLPVLVFFVSVAFGVAKFEKSLLWTICIISVGTILVAEGEVDMSLMGLILQAVSLVFESVRLVMIEVLLKSKGISLNPITTLYYVAPITLLCISVPAAIFEFQDWGKMVAMVQGHPGTFLLNCSLAFFLNLAVFLIIGKTSALTMNIAGISKDIIVIALSTVLFAAPLYAKSCFGFLVVIIGVALYNYMKYKITMAEKEAKLWEQEHSHSQDDVELSHESNQKSTQ